MSEQEFSKHMARLMNTFGKQAYGPERCDLIFRVVKDFSASWFSDLIDELIGGSRYAPLLPEFREAVSLERERSYRRDKEQHTKQAREFWSSLADEEIQSVCEGVRMRIKGQMTDEEWHSFMMLLKQFSHRGKSILRGI